MIKHCPPRAQEKFVKFFTLSEMIWEIPFIRPEKFPQTGRAPPKVRAAGGFCRAITVGNDVRSP
jgi:hypothetical protein